MSVEIRKRPLLGTRAFVHSIVLDGQLVHEQVGPYSEDEIEQRVRAHLNPSRPVPYVLPELVPGARTKGAIGGRRKAAVNDHGFLWREEEE